MSCDQLPMPLSDTTYPFVSMKKPDTTKPKAGFLGAYLIALSAIGAFFMVGKVMMSTFEINAQGYDEIKALREKHPEVVAKLVVAMQDDYVTWEELDEMNEYCRRLELRKDLGISE